jgi:prolyl oligopeptidase
MVQRVDHYLWLEDFQDPKVHSWFSERDKASRKLLKRLSARLMPKMRRYWSIPYTLQLRTSRDGHFALQRYLREFAISKINSGSLSKLVSSKELGKDAVIQRFNVSDKGDKLAFFYSFAGSDEGFSRTINVKTGEVLDELKGQIDDVVMLDHGRYYYGKFYATEKTPDGVEAPAVRVFLREDGEDKMVFGKGLPTSYFVSLKKSQQSAQALLTVGQGWTRSDVYAGRIEEPETWTLLYGKGDFIAWPIDCINGKCFVASFDKGGMGRILAIDGNGRPEEIIGEQLYPLQGAAIAENRIVTNYLVDASSMIKFFSLSGSEKGQIKPKPPGVLGQLESNGVQCVFIYESFLIPYRICLLEGEKLTVLASKEIRGDFAVEDLWVRSKDGTPIHMFRVGKSNNILKKALVWGYGGFSIALTPSFHPDVMPFVEDGGVFIVANLRGGNEFGEKWHREGMREKKQNVFDDFLAVLKYLRQNGQRIVGYGRSNGGLLIGTTLTQHPEFLDGALIGYPVLDMFRFDKLFIGRAWVPEYGDPDEPKDAEFLVEYSPYHNIAKRKYPPIMLFTGLHDDRVHPAHAFKFAARLEEFGASPLLRVETKSGHSGATPITKIVEYAETMAFVYRTLGMRVKDMKTKSHTKQ